jgi:ribosome modulation factor
MSQSYDSFNKRKRDPLEVKAYMQGRRQWEYDKRQITKYNNPYCPNDEARLFFAWIDGWQESDDERNKEFNRACSIS